MGRRGKASVRERAGRGRREGPSQSLSSHRLPPGRHGIPPEQVVESQRWRLLGAAAEVLAERGYAGIRGADVCARAGVSRATLYEHFEGLQDLLLAAYEMTAECIVDLASPACEVTTLAEILEFLAEEPALAHLLGPEVAAGVPAIAAARERLIERLADMGAERHCVEGALALVSERVAAGDAARLPELAPQLAELITPREPAAGASDQSDPRGEMPVPSAQRDPRS